MRSDKLRKGRYAGSRGCSPWETRICFIESVFQVQLELLQSDPAMEMWAFPMAMDRPGIGGTLVKMEGAASGGSGMRVYFSCKDCEVEAALAAKSGGQLYREKMSIDPYGFMALVVDTEGNMIGLHSME